MITYVRNKKNDNNNMIREMFFLRASCYTFYNKDQTNIQALCAKRKAGKEEDKYTWCSYKKNESLGYNIIKLLHEFI